MIDSWSFYNDSLWLPLLLSAIGLWLVFIYKELKLFRQIRFFVRIFVALLVLVCLSIIILKPFVFKAEDTVKALLLTDNYKDNHLDSLKSKHQDLKILNYEPNRQIIPDSIFVDSIYILGNGLEVYDLWQLKNLKARYIQGNEPSGITKLKYKCENSVDDELNIRGIYSNGEVGNRLVLEGPSGISLDSLEIEELEQQAFQLNTELNVAGNFLYKLVEKKTDGSIVLSEELPIKVKQKEALQILIMNAFPTFETKYLKNFLEENGHGLVVRSQLTVGRYKFEYLNLPNTPINNLTKDALKDFDVFIMDYNSLRNLSKSEINEIQKAISLDGLGLLIQPEDALFRSNHSLVPFEFGPNTSLRTLRDGQTNIGFTKYPFLFDEESQINKVSVIDSTIVSAYKFMGLGKIGTTLLSNTYHLILNGQDRAYKNVWSKMLSETSKRISSSIEWESQQELIYVDEPFHFKLRTNLPNPIVKDEQNAIIPLIRNFDIPTVWHGTTYPLGVGWQELSVEQDSLDTFHYYVHKTEGWKSLKTSKQIEENQRFFNSKVNKSLARKWKKPVNLLWFYIIALMGLAYLWLAPKLAFRYL